MAGVNSLAVPLVKGTALIGFFKFVKTRPRGEAAAEEILRALPEEAGRVCRKKVIAVGDYSYSIFVAYIRAMDRVLGQGDLALCRQLGEFVANLNIQFATQMSKKRPLPEDLFRVGDVFWKNYHLNSGYLKAEDSSPDHTVLRIYDFPQMDPAHCRLMEGWFFRAIVETGGVWSEAIHEARCASRGDPYHEFIGRWKLAAPA